MSNDERLQLGTVHWMPASSENILHSLLLFQNCIVTSFFYLCASNLQLLLIFRNNIFIYNVICIKKYKYLCTHYMTQYMYDKDHNWSCLQTSHLLARNPSR